MRNALIYTVIFAALQIVISLIGQLIWKFMPGHDGVMNNTFMMITLSVCNVLIMVVFLGAKWTKVSRNWIQTRPWSVLFWCVMAAMGCIIPSMWLQELMPELPNLAEAYMEELLASRVGYFVVGLLAPMAEEMVFRGAILCSLLKWTESHWLAIAISALLFAISHFNPAQFPHAFLIGILLGWLYYRTGSILPGMVFHWINNSVAYAMFNISKAAYGTADLTLGELVGEPRVLLAVAFSLLILVPALFQLNMRMKRC